MQIDVFFGAHSLTPADLNGRVVLVVDVLRASTSIAVALSNGARAIIPCESAEEAITRSKSFQRPDVRLAGERRMLPIAGFDFGNSPREFTPAAVAGKTIMLTTTNGTSALIATQGGREVVVGSYVNLAPVLAMLRAASRSGTDIAIVCAGADRRFSLEDAACAGRFVRGIARRGIKPKMNDAATVAVLVDRRFGDDVPALLRASAHGRALAEAGFGDDLTMCATIDSHPVVPVYMDRQIVRLGATMER